MIARACRSLARAGIVVFSSLLISLSVDCVSHGALPGIVGSTPALANDSEDRRDWERERSERQRQKIELDRERAERARQQAEIQAQRTMPATQPLTSTTQNAVSTAGRPQSNNFNAKPVQNQDTASQSKSVSSNDDGQDDDSADSGSGSGNSKTSGDRSGKSRGTSDRNSKRNGQDVSIQADDDQVPNTLKGLFEKFTSGAGPSNGEHGKGKDSNDKPTETGALPGTVGYKDGNPDRGRDHADDKSADGSTVPASGPSKGGNGNTPTTVPKRGRPDFELLKLGDFKPREIMAARLSPDSAARVNGLGFKLGQVVHAPGQTGDVRRLVIPGGMSEAKALELLRQNLPDGDFEPNHVYHITPAADDEAGAKSTKVAALSDEKAYAPCFGDHCFARDLIGWKPQLKSCARTVKVGLIDTSFDVGHPAFAGHKMKLNRFAGDGTANLSDWHGTAVLSVLAGDSQSGTPGLVPDASFLLASTFSSDRDGNAVADSIAVLNALAWLDSEKVDIVNMSFSGPANDLIKNAIDDMSKKGVIFVAAAGNRGVAGPASYPAAYPQVIAVTAVGKNKQNYRHANRGDYVDVSAPGIDVWAALPGGKQGYRTGTSFAAPFITGLLAAMPAVRKNVFDKRDLLSRISFEDLGERGRDPVYGEGLPHAPTTCNEIGGIASLPWSQEAKRMMMIGGPKPAPAPIVPVATQLRPAAR